jgi:peptide/nickel transport system substrate-binding protein
MRTMSRALGRPLLICMLIGAMALLVAACGGGSSNSGGGGGTGSSTSGGGSSTSGGGSGTTANPNNANTAASKYGTVLFGSLPAPGTPAKGGTLTVSQQTGQTPLYIFPEIPAAQTSTGTIDMIQNLYMPLYDGPSGAIPKVDYDLSFAKSAPVPSNHDKTYTVYLKTCLKWSDGKPMTANDVLFWYYTLKAAITESASNWGQYVPGEFPADVTSAKAPNAHTVVFNLNTPYNPGFFLNNQLQDTNNVYPLPSEDWDLTGPGQKDANWKSPAVAKKIYDYLNSQGKAVSGFATSPLWKVNSGPFKLKAFSATNGSYKLVPNPSYGGTPKSQADEVDVNTYTSQTAALNALQGGSLDVDYLPDPSQINQIKGMSSQGIQLYGGPGWGWFGGQINFQDSTDHFDKVIAQRYVRGAIDSLINQPAIIKGVYKGAAVTAYGPVSSAPSSPYAPADAAKPPYPFNPSAAVAMLKSHGWNVVPGGTTTCAKPGTGAGECGAGIPKGTPIKFVWGNQPQAASTTGVLESEALASQAKKSAGIDIELATKSFNFLISEWTDTSPDGLKNHDDWGVNNFGGLFQDYYPTQDGVVNHGGTATKPAAGFNTGSFADPKADKLIQASVHGGNPAAVKAEASYLEKSLPSFYFPSADNLAAVNTKKIGSSADGWLVITQQSLFPQFWYSVK